jgi:hypothetical protein
VFPPSKVGGKLGDFVRQVFPARLTFIDERYRAIVAVEQ